MKKIFCKAVRFRPTTRQLSLVAFGLLLILGRTGDGGRFPFLAAFPPRRMAVSPSFKINGQRLSPFDEDQAPQGGRLFSGAKRYFLSPAENVPPVHGRLWEAQKSSENIFSLRRGWPDRHRGNTTPLEWNGESGSSLENTWKTTYPSTEFTQTSLR